MSRSLTSGVISNVIGRFSILIIGLLFTPILVRILGPIEYGRYATIISIFAIASFLMASGTNDAIRKFISEKEETHWRNSVFGFLFRTATILSCLFALIFYFTARFGLVSQVFGPAYVPLFYLLAVLAIGRQAEEFFYRTLMGLELEIYSEAIRIGRRAVFVTLALIASYLGHGVAGVIIADIVASILAFVILAAILSRYLGILESVLTSAEKKTKKRISYYTGETVIFFTLLMSLYHVDILVLQQFRSEHTVGLYKGALVIAETLWIVPVAIQLAILQRTSSLWEQGKTERIQNLATITTRFSLSATLLLVIGVATLASPLVTIYLGEKFQSAVTPLLLLLPGVVGFAAARPTIAINQSHGNLRPLIISTGVVALANLLLNLILIPRYGMVGAAIATSTGYGSLIIIQYAVAQFFGYSPFRDVRALRILVAVIITTAVIFPISRSLSAIPSLIVVLPIGLLIYLVCSISLGVFTFEEIEYISQKLPNGYSQKISSAIHHLPKLYKM